MTRRRIRALRRTARATLDCLAVAGAACLLVLIVAGVWLASGGDIVLAAGAGWWLP